MAGERVLVVDDDPGIRSVLRGYLEQAGYGVTEATDGAGALASFAELDPQVVLLDVGLPDIDGLEVLRQIRATSRAYVLLVTARVEEVDRLVGLGMGADDYITKPFSPREVVARVAAFLRRAALEIPPTSTDGPLRVDHSTREVHVDGAPVELSALEFDLLAFLISRPGQVFTRAQILEHVWGGDWFGDQRVVDVHIRSLRQHLGDDATDPRFIATVRGVGYKVIKGS
ncbi:response regulator transcription factor [Nocardioides sp.]|uniref:response regulator transcription factor n=1 Tax=Nocardioides sp. TaxID=35761 RepID=UPI003566F7A2